MKAAYIGIDFLFPALPALAGCGCEIMKIFSCETDNVTEFNTRVCGYAREHGIPLQLERIRKSDLEELAGQGCELVVCAGYYYKIPVPEGMRIVNIHPSYLPSGRGGESTRYHPDSIRTRLPCTDPHLPLRGIRPTLVTRAAPG